MTVTGVLMTPIFSSSAIASWSAMTSFSTKDTPFCERNSFVRPQKAQPGWVYMTISLAIAFLPLTML